MGKAYSFGVWVKLRRKALDLTQEQLAQCVGCSLVTIRKIERDERRPSRQITLLLAHCLNVPEAEYPRLMAVARRDRAVTQLDHVPNAPLPVIDLVERPSRESPPPPSTLNTQLTNLPVQPTPFIGREREVAAVLGLLRRTGARLVTLTGTGGTGKTRLALQVAADMLDEHANGVYFVALATVIDSQMVMLTIASTLGIREASSQPIADTLKDYLRDKNLLLVLDNLEQVIQSAPQIADLLAAAPRLKIIATSRERLRIRGEHEFAVQPLAIPDLKHRESVAALSQCEAVALFIQRAKAARDGWELTDENAHAVVEVCVRLDGLPLALELAAARSKLLSPQALLDRLSNRLKALTGGARDMPARQQTVRSTIEWSYNLLDEAEKTLFARLAVFVGGWTVEAAEAVCNFSSSPMPLDVFDGLASLADKSLIRQTEGDAGEPRLVMLETLREFARERLAQSGEEQALQARHQSYFLALAEQAGPRLFGPEQAAWVDRLDQEHDNFRVAIEWLLKNQQAETALRLSAAIWWFWYVRGYDSEGLDFLRQAVSHSESVRPTVARAKALTGIGWIRWAQGSPADARPPLEEAAQLAREIKDTAVLIDALRYLGFVITNQGDIDASRSILEECLALSRNAGNQTGIGFSLFALGDVAVHEDDYVRAQAFYEESVAVLRELKDKDYLAYALRQLGRVALRKADYAASAALSQESLKLNQEMRNTRGTAASLTALAEVAAAQGQPERTTRLLGAAQALLDSVGATLFSMDRAAYQRVFTLAQSRLGEGAFKFAWDIGQTMTLEQAVAYCEP